MDDFCNVKSSETEETIHVNYQNLTLSVESDGMCLREDTERNFGKEKITIFMVTASTGHLANYSTISGTCKLYYVQFIL